MNVVPSSTTSSHALPTVFIWDDNKKPSHFRSLREAANLTQRELASIIGQHHSNVGFWEISGKLPSAEFLPVIAKTLGVSVDDLLGSRQKKRSCALRGKAYLAFEAVSNLPRRKQKEILEVVSALVTQYSVTHTKL